MSILLVNVIVRRAKPDEAIPHGFGDCSLAPGVSAGVALRFVFARLALAPLSARGSQ